MAGVAPAPTSSAENALREGLLRVRDEVANPSLEVAGATVFGSAWPLVQPLAKFVLGAKGPNDLAVERAVMEWAALAAAAAERTAVAEFQSLVVSARTKDLVVLGTESRRLQLKAPLRLAARAGLVMCLAFQTLDAWEAEARCDQFRECLWALGAPSDLVKLIRVYVMRSKADGEVQRAIDASGLVQDYLVCSATLVCKAAFLVGWASVGCDQPEQDRRLDSIRNYWTAAGLPATVLSPDLSSCRSIERTEAFCEPLAASL